MKVKQALGWIAFSEAVGIASGFLSRTGMKEYMTSVRKPFFSPPPLVFPIVWSVLFALMGWGAAKMWEKKNKPALIPYFLQLAVNFFWPILFFNAKRYGLAALWLALLLVLAGWMALAFYREDKTAGKLQIPYLLWLCFALVLNISVWLLN